MAQPVSSIIGDLLKSSRSIAHRGAFEGYKSIQTNSWQQTLVAWIYYIGVLLRVAKSNPYIGALLRVTKLKPYWYGLKFLAMQVG